MVIRYDGDLISDAEIKLHLLIDLKTAKHNSGADKELVSPCTHATGPLGVVKCKFRPEIFADMILQSYAGEECIADVFPIVRRERITNRPLHVEIAPADPS